MITTTMRQLIPCSQALAVLGDLDGLTAAQYVQISKVQLEVNRWLAGHAKAWNSLVEACGENGAVLPQLSTGEPNPQWQRWLRESPVLEEALVELKFAFLPWCVSDFAKLERPPKSSVLTPLLEVGLLALAPDDTSVGGV